MSANDWRSNAPIPMPSVEHLRAELLALADSLDPLPSSVLAVPTKRRKDILRSRVANRAAYERRESRRMRLLVWLFAVAAAAGAVGGICHVAAFMLEGR
jgi:hypothetical protein